MLTETLHEHTGMKTIQRYVSRLARKLYFENHIGDNPQIRQLGQCNPCHNKHERPGALLTDYFPCKEKHPNLEQRTVTSYTQQWKQSNWITWGSVWARNCRGSSPQAASTRSGGMPRRWVTLVIQGHQNYLLNFWYVIQIANNQYIVILDMLFILSLKQQHIY